MPLRITARNVGLSNEDRDHIEARVDRFRKLAVGDQISVLDVVLAKQKGLFTVEVVVKASRFNAAGKETDGDLRAAIDRVMGKVERQLRKQLDKRRTQKRHPREGQDRHAVTLTMSFTTGSSPEVEEEYRIVRTERIASKPMSVEEAAEQLEVATGSFLVFRNAETDQVNIIYRLEDGNFGLIEPS